MNVSHDELIGYYSERAEEFDRIYHKPERQDDLRKLRGLVSRLLTGQTLLEIACGTGYWTTVLSHVATFILATDINQRMIDEALRKEYAAGRVSFKRCDAYDLTGLSGDFSAAFAAFWWSHIPPCQLPGFLDGLHRRLGPGGTVVFLDNCYVDGSSTPISRVGADGESYQIRRLASGKEFEVLKNFPDDGELKQAVKKAGTDIVVERLPHYWCMHYTLR
jgi:ubiquinone/menaquinone biosynthesis C-methylase UbiE